MKINNQADNKQNFTSLTPLKKPLGVFYNPNAVLPMLAIEGGTTIGRSIEAYKRGGLSEATDRFVEQGTSAVVWIWGVSMLKKLGETFGKKVLKLKNLDFSLGSDSLRNPIKNNKIDPKTIGFKAGNILVSTVLATYFIGFILPKISSKISNKFSSKDKKETSNTTLNPKHLTFEEFKKKTSNKNNINFTSLLDKTLLLADVIENNSTKRLLITDTGVIAGRCKNAKSIYKKIENLFRDIASIYFYLFATAHSVKTLNKITKNTDIDPKILSKMFEKLKDFEGSKEDFLNQTLGRVDNDKLKELDELFNSREVISLDEFKQKFPEYSKKAYKMAELQPIFDDKRFLSKVQAKDVLSNGKITDPEFLKETFNHATNYKSSDKLKYISKESLEKMRFSMDDFIKQIYNSSNGNVNKELIEKVMNKNIIKNFGFYSLGTVLSMGALGVLIPKIQYAITRMLTHSNSRPE